MRNICMGFNFPRSSFERVNTTYTRRNLMGPDSRSVLIVYRQRNQITRSPFPLGGRHFVPVCLRVRLRLTRLRDEEKKLSEGNCCVHK